MVTRVVHIHENEFKFIYARSSGPGGQNVNKTNSKATLFWNLDESRSITDDIRMRFRNLYPNRINDENEVVISSDETRDRAQNQARCIEKLMELLTVAANPPKKRTATKPTKSSKRRRLEDKQRRGAVKSNRGKITDW